MNKIYKILGKEGRTTIPFALRIKYGYKPNDILSYEDKGDGTPPKRRCTPK